MLKDSPSCPRVQSYRSIKPSLRGMLSTWKIAVSGLYTPSFWAASRRHTPRSLQQPAPCKSTTYVADLCVCTVRCLWWSCSETATRRCRAGKVRSQDARRAPDNQVSLRGAACCVLCFLSFQTFLCPVIVAGGSWWGPWIPCVGAPGERRGAKKKSSASSGASPDHSVQIPVAQWYDDWELLKPRR